MTIMTEYWQWCMNNPTIHKIPIEWKLQQKSIMIFSNPYDNQKKDSIQDILNHFDVELYYNWSIQETPQPFLSS